MFFMMPGRSNPAIEFVRLLTVEVAKTGRVSPRLSHARSYGSGMHDPFRRRRASNSASHPVVTDPRSAGECTGFAVLKSSRSSVWPDVSPVADRRPSRDVFPVYLVPRQSSGISFTLGSSPTIRFRFIGIPGSPPRWIPSHGKSPLPH
jgi:hypothetical protein